MWTDTEVGKRAGCVGRKLFAIIHELLNKFEFVRFIFKLRMCLVGTDFSESKCEMLCNELAYPRFKALYIIRRRGIAGRKGKVIVKTALNHRANAKLRAGILLLDGHGQQMRQ